MTIWRENPRARIEWRDGSWWHEDPGSTNWIHLGFCETPHGAARTIRYHVLHGLLTGYRWRDIARYAWRHRRSFT